MSEREDHRGAGERALADVDPVGQNPDPLLSARAAARYLGLIGVVKHPEQAVRSLCRKRRLRSTRVAGKVMVRRSWLEAYLEQNARLAAV